MDPIVVCSLAGYPFAIQRTEVSDGKSRRSLIYDLTNINHEIA